MAEQDPSSKYIPDLSGPFSQYLSQIQPPAQQPMQQPSGREGKTGQTAFFLNSFLEGAQRGRYQQQQNELAKERQADQTVAQYLKLLDDKDPAQAQQLRQKIVTEQGRQAMAFMEQGSKGKGKKGHEGPFKHVLGAVKSLGEGLLGGPVKKWDGYGDKMGEWAQAIVKMPSKDDAYKRDQNQFNQVVEQVRSDAQGGDPSKPVYMENILQHPKVREAATAVESRYGKNPMVDLEKSKAFPSDPNRDKTPEQIKAEQETNKLTALKAETERKIWDGKDPEPGAPVTPEFIARREMAGLATSGMVVSDGKTNFFASKDKKTGRWYNDQTGEDVTTKVQPKVPEKAESWTSLARPGYGPDGNWHPVSHNTSTGENKLDMKIISPAPSAPVTADEREKKEFAKQVGKAKTKFITIESTKKRAESGAEKAFSLAEKSATAKRIAARAKAGDDPQAKIQVEKDFNEAMQTALDAKYRSLKDGEIAYGSAIDSVNREYLETDSNLEGMYTYQYEVLGKKHPGDKSYKGYEPPASKGAAPARTATPPSAPAGKPVGGDAFLNLKDQ